MKRVILLIVIATLLAPIIFFALPGECEARGDEWRSRCPLRNSRVVNPTYGGRSYCICNYSCVGNAATYPGKSCEKRGRISRLYLPAKVCVCRRSAVCR